MYRTLPILQKRSAPDGPARKDPHIRETGIVTDIHLTVFMDHLVRWHTQFLGHVVYIMGSQHNILSLRATLPAFCAVESERIIQAYLHFVEVFRYLLQSFIHFIPLKKE